MNKLVYEEGVKMENIRLKTDSDNEILLLVEDLISKQISRNERLLDISHISRNDTDSPRYYWRKGQIVSSQELLEVIQHYLRATHIQIKSHETK